MCLELTLTLFMAWIFADDADHAFAANDAAEFAERFDGCTDTHKRSAPS